MTSELVHSEKCRHCQYEGPQTVTLATTGLHYAKVTCAKCERMLRWLPKPDSDPTKYRRPASEKELVEKFGEGFCELCLVSQVDLPKGQTLEGHHIREYNAGGKAEAENVLILCTGCHRLVHWIRTYHGSSLNTIGEVLKKWPQ